MIEMKTSNNKEIEIIISHHKYIRKVQFSLIIWLIIPSIVIVLIVTPFLLMFIAEIFILLTSIINYYFRKSIVALEKLIIKEDTLIIQDINNYGVIIFNKEINFNNIKEIFFKDSLSAYFSSGGGMGENRKFLKIRTFNELFSFGILIDKNEYNQIKAIIQKEILKKNTKFNNI